jgi:hypothetical protein
MRTTTTTRPKRQRDSRLLELARERGIGSWAELAVLAEVAPSSVGLFVRGYRPARLTERIARALGVRPEELA